MISILLIDDEQEWLNSFKRTLLQYNIAAEDSIYTVQSGRQAMKALSTVKIDLIFLDLIMNRESGEDVLRQIMTEYPSAIVVIMTGTNDIQAAVRCTKNGATDYFVKTVSIDELISGIRRVTAFCYLVNENKALKKGFLSEHTVGFDEFITESPKIKAIFKYLTAVVNSKEPVLITGESGVGKGVLAKAFAQLAKPGKPFLSINIAGVDSQVFSDTLFGHVKGAYTGAETRRTGLIQQANGGVLFLDEIGELPSHLQVKLLYLVQDGVYQQLGSDNILNANVRFVLATNKNLEDMKNSGEFRKDLYYRITTHHVHIPSLKERKDDIPLLFRYFIDQVAAENGMSTLEYDENIIEYLQNYSFPGNIRQLRSVVYNAVIKSEGAKLTVDDFSGQIVSYAPDSMPLHLDDVNLPTVDEMIDQLIDKAMKRAGNNQRKAAALIGLSQSTLSRRLKNR